MSMETSALTSDKSSQRHPLLLPVVLESVFNVNNDNDIKWSIQDLKNLRLVCKSWNEVLLPRWRSSATLRLLQNNKDVECDENTKGIFATEFAQYLQDPRDAFQLRAKPFSKYKLIEWNVDGTNFEVKNTWTIIRSQVKNLDLMHCTMNPGPDSFGHLVNLLIELELPLESLSISFDEDYIIDLSNLLQCYGKSLKALKLFAPPFTRPYYYEPFGYPLLIEELELFGNVIDISTFLLEMPLLKKLKMDFGCFEKSACIRGSYESRPVYPVTLYKHCLANERESFRMEHLTEFEVDLRLEPSTFTYLAHWTPNMKSFKGIIDNDLFSIACQKWGKLSTLCLLFGSEVDDFGITGNDDSNTPRAYGERSSNIIWLRNLKHFKLQAFCGKGMLTDLSSREGFLKIHLHSLDICVSSKFSIPEEEKLKAAICQVKIRRNYGEHKEEECCRQWEFKKNALDPREEGIPRERYAYLQ